MEKEAKLQYDFLVDCDELNIFFPNMTGNWETDKKRFIEKYKKNKEEIDKFDVRD